MKILTAYDSNFILNRLEQMPIELENTEVAGRFYNGTNALSALHQLKPDWWPTIVLMKP